MAEAFPVSGNIDPQSFPHLLVDLHRHGATGSLKVNGPVHPKALYFRGGRVLFGSSNDPRDQLGAILIESGRITRDQLDEVNAKVGPGNPLAKVLAESGFVNQRELGEAARMKVERILADVLAWDSGTFEFEDGVLPKGAVDLKLSTEKLLLAAVQRIADRPFALRHLELASVLEPSPDGESALSEVRADVWPLLERIDGRRTLKDAIALHAARRVRGRQDGLRDAVSRHRAQDGGRWHGRGRPGRGGAERVRPGAGPGSDVHGAAHVRGRRRLALDERVRGLGTRSELPGFRAGAGRPGCRPPRGGAAQRDVPGGRARPGRASRLQRRDYDAAWRGPHLHDGGLPEAGRGGEQARRADGLRTEDRGGAAARDGLGDAAAACIPLAAAPERRDRLRRSRDRARSPDVRARAAARDRRVRSTESRVGADAGTRASAGALVLGLFGGGLRASRRSARAGAGARDSVAVARLAPQSGRPRGPRRVAQPGEDRRPDRARAPATGEVRAAVPPHVAAAQARRAQCPGVALAHPADRRGPGRRRVLATVAAWFFLLRTPEPRPAPRLAPPTTVSAVATTTLPPATLATGSAPSPLASAAATGAPAPPPVVTPAATPSPLPATPTPATPKPTAVATPAPVPRPAATAASQPAATAHAAGDGRALLRQGSFPEAARSFAASLAPGGAGVSATSCSRRAPPRRSPRRSRRSRATTCSSFR